MNKEEVLAMEAGRELDKLVAEKVMNLCVLDSVQMYGDGCAMSDKGFDEWMKHPMFGKTKDPNLLETYSTDLYAAWEVFTNFSFPIIEKGFDEGDKDYFVCKIGNHRVIQDTVPLAICKAALLAVTDS